MKLRSRATLIKKLKTVFDDAIFLTYEGEPTHYRNVKRRRELLELEQEVVAILSEKKT